MPANKLLTLMKYIILILLFGINVCGFAQYEKYFHDKTLRMDYYHSGDNNQEAYYFDELIEEPLCGGSKINLIDTF